MGVHLGFVAHVVGVLCGVGVGLAQVLEWPFAFNECVDEEDYKKRQYCRRDRDACNSTSPQCGGGSFRFTGVGAVGRVDGTDSDDFLPQTVLPLALRY